MKNSVVKIVYKNLLDSNFIKKMMNDAILLMNKK